MDITPGWLATSIIKTENYTLTVGQLLLAAAIIVLTFIVTSVVRRGLKRIQGREQGLSASHLYVVGRFLHYSILVFGFLFAASTLGADVGKLAIVAGALGVGVGLGLQGIVNNFVSGIVILLEKSLKIGDFVEFSSGLVGEVVEIHMRATLIRTNDNVDILVPNAEVINNMVTNWTMEENIRRFRIPFSVAYGSDKTLVRKAVLEAAATIPYTLSSKGHEPVVWMTGFGDSSLDFVLGVWVTPDRVKRPVALVSDYLWAIDDAFRQYQIEIPFPQRDLHIRSDFAQPPQAVAGKDTAPGVGGN